MLPPRRGRQFPVIEVGAVWESRGTAGHPAGALVRVIGLGPWRVTVEPLDGHGRRKHGGGRRSPTREEFLFAYRPRRTPGA